MAGGAQGTGQTRLKFKRLNILGVELFEQSSGFGAIEQFKQFARLNV